MSRTGRWPTGPASPSRACMRLWTHSEFPPSFPITPALFSAITSSTFHGITSSGWAFHVNAALFMSLPPPHTSGAIAIAVCLSRSWSRELNVVWTCSAVNRFHIPQPAAAVFAVREPLIKWEGYLLEAIGPYFKARAKWQYPQRSCPSEQRRKTAQALPALRVALKRGRGLRWLRSHSHEGCSCVAALPAASFECNKCPSHLNLISGSLAFGRTRPWSRRDHRT